VNESSILVFEILIIQWIHTKYPRYIMSNSKNDTAIHSYSLTSTTNYPQNNLHVCMWSLTFFRSSSHSSILYVPVICFVYTFRYLSFI
jgi:hypothetical protein